MLSVDEMKAMLIDRNPVVVAQLSGVHHRFVLQVKNGTIISARIKTLQKLSDYLEGKKQ